MNQQERMVSLVLLLRSPRRVDENTLRQTAGRALGTTFSADRNAENFLIRQVEGQYPLQFGSRQMGIIYSPEPYLPDLREVLARIAEPEFRDAVRSHKAWISVDWIGDVSPPDRAEAYRLLASVLAELAADDCVALYVTETDALSAWRKETLAALRQPNPIIFLVNNGSLLTRTGDPRMTAAVAEAKRRWPEFLAAWQCRTSGQFFAVKAEFPVDGSNECMWVIANNVYDSSVIGTLDNEPDWIHTLHKGDKVILQQNRIIDFLYIENEKRIGGFTDAVLRERR